MAAAGPAPVSPSLATTEGKGCYARYCHDYTQNGISAPTATAIPANALPSLFAGVLAYNA